MAATTSVIRRPPGSSSLYDVLDLILDKGLVIDAYARVSLVGIDILTVDARVVVASVDTYLRFAAAVDRLAIHEEGKGLVDLVGGSSSSRSRQRDDGPGVLTRAKEAVSERVEGLKERLTDDEEDDER